MRLVFAILTLVAAPLAGAQSAGNAELRYTFSWPFHDRAAMQPRGGTSRGAEVKLDTQPSPQWRALQAAGISRFERDRRAILAMSGGFRTTFDFIETVGFTANFEPARPYQSWGTEYIYVIEDTGEFISLQHIIAMFYVDSEGDVQGPIVQKHWRQDWQYEDGAVHAYSGGYLWQTRRSERPAGSWSQTVYQVDDSPRYAAFGRWQHARSFSTWQSDETWRPLPRRESSVRSDYDVLVGTNSHTILPTGWVQEENNLKTVLAASSGEIERTIARELGVNRYERIVDFDFSSADGYWHATAPFWADVREGWNLVFADMPSFEFIEVQDGRPLWQAMFEYAAKLEAGAEYIAEESRLYVDETLRKHIK